MGDQCGSPVLTVVVSSWRHVVSSVGSGSALLTVGVSSGRPVVASVGRWGTSLVLLCLQ